MNKMMGKCPADVLTYVSERGAMRPAVNGFRQRKDHNVLYVV